MSVEERKFLLEETVFNLYGGRNDIHSSEAETFSRKLSKCLVCGQLWGRSVLSDNVGPGDGVFVLRAELG